MLIIDFVRLVDSIKEASRLRAKVQQQRPRRKLKRREKKAKKRK